MANKPLKILALDLGRKTGWATDGKLSLKDVLAYCPLPGFAKPLDGGLGEDVGQAQRGGFIWGLKTFKRKRGDSQGMLWLAFEGWLSCLLSATKPDLVVYEMPHHRGGAATDILVGLKTCVQRECEKKGVEYTSCHTGMLKKSATGKGNASKEEMLQAAREKWGDGVEDDNVADALHLLAWAKSEFAMKGANDEG